MLNRMSGLRKGYKGKTFGFGCAKEGRLVRTEKREKSRKNQRAETFNENRNISNSAANTPQGNVIQVSSAVEDRMTRLLRWKTERDRRRIQEKTRKRPPFVVGVVHHKIYSPANKEEVAAPCGFHEKAHNHNISATVASPPRRVTRATEKRLKKKALIEKAAKNSMKNSKPTANRDQKNQKRNEHSFAPADYKFKAPSGLPSMPLFGRVAIQCMSPAMISGFMSSPLKSRRSMRSSTTEFNIEEINHKKCDESLTKKDKDNSNMKTTCTELNLPKVEPINDKHDAEESSIEDVSLKLSFDKEESLNLSNIGNNNVSEHNTELKDDIPNNSATKTPPSSLNDTFTTNSSIVKTCSSLSNNNITPNKTVIKTESSSSNNTLTSPYSNSPSEPVFFSPYVVSSRGKSNARKEQQLRRGFSIGHSTSDEIPTKDTVMKNLNISVEEEERTAQYFLYLLNKEVERLNEVCNKWVEIKDEPETTEDGQYQINQAVGQTHLLINKKFERFRRLVSDCETGKGEMLVTCKDLQGFWDMMYMEVKDCDLRFEKVEKLRSHHWKEEQPSVLKPIAKKKTAIKKKVVPAKSSVIKSFLAERKQKMLQTKHTTNNTEELGIVNKQIASNKEERTENSPSVKLRTRRSMSIGPNETKCTSTKREGSRQSLLQKVQLSETSKAMKSPLTIIKISQMCKTPEVQLDDTISYVNSDQTPGKSILKQSKDFSVKSTHKVNFNDDIALNEVPIDEETQTKRDLAAAFARIDSFDLGSHHEELSIHVERKLTFNDSFEESENIFEGKQSELNSSINNNTFEVPFIQVQDATPLKELTSNEYIKAAPSKTKTLRRQNAVTKDDEVSNEFSLINGLSATPLVEIGDDANLNTLKEKSQKHVSTNNEEETEKPNESVRVLRNRTVTSEAATPRRSVRKVSMSVQELEHKENKTPSRTRRKSSVMVSINDDAKINSKIDLPESMDKMSLHETNDKRKSSRRSVRFDEKQCTGCVETKQALPMTPHVRRSKLQTTQKKKSILTHDLISWETPEKLPERIRRSQHKRVNSLI